MWTCLRFLNSMRSFFNVNCTTRSDFLASQIYSYQRKDAGRQIGGIAYNLPGRHAACPPRYRDDAEERGPSRQQAPALLDHPGHREPRDTDNVKVLPLLVTVYVLVRTGHSMPCTFVSPSRVLHLHRCKGEPKLTIMT